MSKNFLSVSDSEVISDYLRMEVESAVDGKAVMTWLGENRPTMRDAVLCHFYDVACYHVGTSCFADSARDEDRDRWFVSVVSGSLLDCEGKELEMADSRAEAEELAVKAYDLVAKFYGAQVLQFA